MNYLYEYSDILNTPYEAFEFDTLKNDFPVRPHFHHYVEFIYMLEGNMFSTAEEKEYYLKEGDLLLIFPDTVHSMAASSVKGARFMGMKFDASRLTVNTTSIPRLGTMLTAARKQSARVLFEADEHLFPGVYEFVLQCEKELRERKLGYEVSVHARLCLFMTDLIRLWEKEGIGFGNVSEYVTKEEISLQNLLEYMDRHIEEGLRVEDLAKRCGMSYSHFARSFKSMYGRTCKEHLELIRVEKAEEMLKFTDYTLNEIALELGYADQSHFARVFKNLKGITPGSVRGR